MLAKEGYWLGKRALFTVTTGRSGSNLLTEVLSCRSSICSLHEPSPSFDSVMSLVQQYPFVANEFLLKKKKKAIERSLGQKLIYSESSHLFCKGFLEAWLDIDELPIPDLICLDRDLRKVSKSLYQLNTIPARTWKGVRYYLSPSDGRNLTALPDWKSLNDYQLCFWYCLEIEARKKHYASLISEHGGLCLHTSIDKLTDSDSFEQFCTELNLPEFSVIGRLRYKRIIGRMVNHKGHKKGGELSNDQLDEWEGEVSDRIEKSCVSL